jgi:hypothetical protein
MKQFIFIVILIITIISCRQLTEKKYEYIELEAEESLQGNIEINEKDKEIIWAKNDSIAYLKAYRKFCISEKVVQDIEEAIEYSASKPTDFKLLDEDGKDITILIDFDKIDSLKADIRSSIFDKKNTMKESINEARDKEISNFKKTAKVDSTKIKKLKPFFDTKNDEFDPRGRVWYKPKSAPRYPNRNGIYCYFQTNDGVPSNLRLKLQYHADSWLFFHKVQFSIDGKAYEFYPTDTETDSGNGGKIWEWFDEPMRKSNTDLLDALANAKNAKMKLVGEQYYKIKTISASQIRDIKRTLELYKAMGGVY